MEERRGSGDKPPARPQPPPPLQERACAAGLSSLGAASVDLLFRPSFVLGVLAPAPGSQPIQDFHDPVFTRVLTPGFLCCSLVLRLNSAPSRSSSGFPLLGLWVKGPSWTPLGICRPQAETLGVFLGGGIRPAPVRAARWVHGGPGSRTEGAGAGAAAAELRWGGAGEPRFSERGGRLPCAPPGPWLGPAI